MNYMERIDELEHELKEAQKKIKELKEYIEAQADLVELLELRLEKYE